MCKTQLLYLKTDANVNVDTKIFKWATWSFLISLLLRRQSVEGVVKCRFSGNLKRFTGHQGKVGDHLYSSLTLVSAQEHSDVYLQLCMWDDCHVFLIASPATTRLLLLNKTYHFIELPFDWLMMECVNFFFGFRDELILGFHCSSLT